MFVCSFSNAWKKKITELIIKHMNKIAKWECFGSYARIGVTLFSRIMRKSVAKHLLLVGKITRLVMGLFDHLEWMIILRGEGG